MNLGNVFADLLGIERMKQNVRARGENPFLMFAQMHQADAGHDLMMPALQAREHPPRLGLIARFAEDFIVEKNQRVRAQHQRVGMFFGHGERLAMGIELADLQRREMFVRHFRDLAGHDLKINLSAA